jgi:HEAT repeat protein
MCLIGELSENPNSVQTIYGLAEFPCSSAVDALVAAGETSNVGAAIANTLGRIAEKNYSPVFRSQKAIDFLLQLLRSAGAMSRANAAAALGLTRSARAIEPLKVALQDSDEVVRENAREAIDCLNRTGYA